MTPTVRTALIVVAVLALLPVLFLAAASALSRVPGNLGVRDGRLSPCPATPNCVCSFDSGRHAIEPLTFTGDPSAAWDRFADALAGIPRLRVVSRSETYLHAQSTSRIFRFVDDVEFLLDRDRRVIHVRSASRAGRSDLGVNRARIEEIRARFAAGA